MRKAPRIFHKNAFCSHSQTVCCRRLSILLALHSNPFTKTLITTWVNRHLSFTVKLLLSLLVLLSFYQSIVLLFLSHIVHWCIQSIDMLLPLSKGTASLIVWQVHSNRITTSRVPEHASTVRTPRNIARFYSREVTTVLGTRYWSTLLLLPTVYSEYWSAMVDSCGKVGPPITHPRFVQSTSDHRIRLECKEMTSTFSSQ